MGDIGKFFNNGKKIALPVKVIFTGKPVNQFYRFLPDFTGKNAQVYVTREQNDGEQILPDHASRLLDPLAGLRCQHQPAHVIAQQGELRHRRRQRGLLRLRVAVVRARIVRVTCCGGDNLNPSSIRFGPIL